jgi:hypothetical protein
MCWERVHTFVHTRKERPHSDFVHQLTDNFVRNVTDAPVAFGGFKVARVRTAFASFGSSDSGRGVADNFVRDVPENFAR